jgi:Protein of unknown function (DUF3788)
VMIVNAFIDKPETPADEEVTAALGRTKRLWDQVVREPAVCGVTTQEWNSYSPKAGWALRLKRKERAIVYRLPCRGSFMASFALRDKAVQAARLSGLPPEVLRIVDEARRYAEGTAVRIEVRSAADVIVVKKLVAAKLAN